MSSTVRDIVMHCWEFSARKHDLGDGYAEENLNKMTRLEFLEAISQAIEDRLCEKELRL